MMIYEMKGKKIEMITLLIVIHAMIPTTPLGHPNIDKKGSDSKIDSVKLGVDRSLFSYEIILNCPLGSDIMPYSAVYFDGKTYIGVE